MLVDGQDGEGEWITPSNVALHKSRALDLLPSEGAGHKGKQKQETIPVGCMTADFAMQNVLLQMGLGLVGVGSAILFVGIAPAANAAASSPARPATFQASRNARRSSAPPRHA